MAAINQINNRRTHSVKVLAQANKPPQNKKTEDKSLSHQYRIIRKDVQKLRNDLALGYDLLKRWFLDLRQKSVHNE
jgi:hypothetical protein